MGSEIYKRNTVNEPVILVENISKYFGSKKILSNINFIVNTGEIFSLIGPNGAGKTTTMRIILGLLTPSSGQVRVFGANSSNSKSFLKNVSAVLEKDVLWEKFTGLENISIASYIWGLDKKLAIKTANEYAELFKLDSAFKYPVYSYSKGMRRKLSIIMSLIRNPDLLILDEPNSGLDPESRIDIRETLLLFKNNGKTVFVTSHDLEEIQKISDQIAIINKGKIVLLDKTQAIIDTGMFKIIVGIGKKPDFSEIATFLKENNIPYKIEGDALTLEVKGGEETIQKITKGIVEKGYPLKEVKEKEESLESMYMKMVKEEEGEQQK